MWGGENSHTYRGGTSESSRCPVCEATAFSEGQQPDDG